MSSLFVFAKSVCVFEPQVHMDDMVQECNKGEYYRVALHTVLSTAYAMNPVIMLVQCHGLHMSLALVLNPQTVAVASEWWRRLHLSCFETQACDSCEVKKKSCPVPVKFSFTESFHCLWRCHCMLHCVSVCTPAVLIERLFYVSAEVCHGHPVLDSLIG